MATEISDRAREIADARGVPESEVFEQALELGIADLWENVVLGKYVDGKLSREKTIELVGLENVQRSDREAAAVEEDVDWGLNA
ncbi:hypothetical protein [Haladaptatus sp. AB643]|uniref:hypothetical protein n=1 Tax=Haladaptatus sp. AB643 TaxID=2934174 RepID=UPI00209C5D89|nr:hypothetical protein [Haladaptatus sp. AB643]MCO8245314.1 hypothetical protein [Haladaptatus sp. AB643]